MADQLGAEAPGGPAANRTGAPLQAWLALGAICIATFTTTLDIQLVNFSLGPLSDVLGVDASQIAWVAVTALLVSVGLMLTAGNIGDSLGRDRILTAGLAITTVSLVLSSLAQNLPQLLVARAVFGLGTIFVVAPAAALIVSIMPPSHRGIGLGFQGMAAGLGYFLGPPLGGLILDHFDWHALFYLRLPFHLAAFAMAIIFLRMPRQGGMFRFDTLGVIVSALTLVSLTLAINQGGRLGWAHPLPLAAGAATPLFGALLVLVERRVARPVFNFRLLAHAHSYTVGLVTHLLVYHVQTAIPILAAFLVLTQTEGGLAQAGLITSTYPLARVLMSPVSGWLSDRLGVQRLIISGLLVLGGAALLLGLYAAEAPIWAAALGFFVAGVGFVLWEPGNQIAVVEGVPREDIGTASSMISMVRLLGVSIGVTVTTAAFVFASSRSAGVSTEDARLLDLPAAAAGAGIEFGFIVMAVFTAVALLVSALRRWMRPVAQGA